MRRLISILVLLLVLMVTVLPASGQEPELTPQANLPVILKGYVAPPRRPPDRPKLQSTGLIHGWTWLTWGGVTQPWYHYETLILLADGSGVGIAWQYATDGYYKFDGLPPGSYTLVGVTGVPFDPPVLCGKELKNVLVGTQANLVMTCPPSW